VCHAEQLQLLELIDACMLCKLCGQISTCTSCLRSWCYLVCYALWSRARAAVQAAQTG
jgi:hypothetical protein